MTVEYRHPAGMRVVSTIDKNGNMVMFPVDHHAYRITYEGSREVFVDANTAKELLGSINNQLRLSQN